MKKRNEAIETWNKEAGWGKKGHLYYLTCEEEIQEVKGQLAVKLSCRREGCIRNREPIYWVALANMTKATSFRPFLKNLNSQGIRTEEQTVNLFSEACAGNKLEFESSAYNGAKNQVRPGGSNSL